MKGKEGPKCPIGPVIYSAWPSLAVRAKLEAGDTFPIIQGKRGGNAVGFRPFRVSQSSQGALLLIQRQEL